MPDSGSPFEQRQIEQDIARLTAELEEKKKQLGLEVESKEEREVIHQVIGEKIQQAPHPHAQQHTQKIVATPLDDDEELPDYLKHTPLEVKHEVHALIQHALRHGIEKAATEAKKHGSFILDAFHDALVDKLYQELKHRKLIT